MHPGPYLDALERLGRQGGGVLDPDTVMSSESWDAALAAAGAAIGAVEQGLATGTAFAQIKRDFDAEALAAVQSAKDAAGFEFLGTLVRTCLLPQSGGEDASSPASCWLTPNVSMKNRGHQV